MLTGGTRRGRAGKERDVLIKLGDDRAKLETLNSTSRSVLSARDFPRCFRRFDTVHGKESRTPPKFEKLEILGIEIEFYENSRGICDARY